MHLEYFRNQSVKIIEKIEKIIENADRQKVISSYYYH